MTTTYFCRGRNAFVSAYSRVSRRLQLARTRAQCCDTDSRANTHPYIALACQNSEVKYGS